MEFGWPTADELVGSHSSCELTELSRQLVATPPWSSYAATNVPSARPVGVENASCAFLATRRLVVGVCGRVEVGVGGLCVAVVGERVLCSGCVAVFVDEPAAGGVSFDRSAWHDRDDVGVVGCALV